MVLAVVAALLLLGCSSESGSPYRAKAPASSGDTLIPAGLPPLPPTGPPRTVCADEPIVCSGVDDYYCAANCQPEPPSLKLNPGDAEVAWAIYQLPVGAWTYETVEFDISFEDQDASNLWLGIADYQTQRWALTQASPGLASISSPYILGSKSPDGCCYLLVLAWDGIEAVVNQVSITLNVPEWHTHTIRTYFGYQESYRGLLLNGTMLYTVYTVGSLRRLFIARTHEIEPAEPTDWIATVVDNDTTTKRVELCVTNGYPAVAYVDKDTQALRYARSVTAIPDNPTDWHHMELDTVPDGDHISLAQVDGRPSIVYVFSDAITNPMVRYAYADTVAPLSATDWVITTVVPSSAPGLSYAHPALIGHDSMAAFTCYVSQTNKVHFYRANNSNPTEFDDWTASPIAGGAAAEAAPSGCVAFDGLPAAVCLLDGVLVYARGDEWWPTTEDQWDKHVAGFDAGGNKAAIEVNNPGDAVWVAWFSPSDYTLHFGWNSGSGSPADYGDWLTQTVATDVDINGTMALGRLSDGRAVIVYYDGTLGELRLATI